MQIVRRDEFDPVVDALRFALVTTTDTAGMTTHHRISAREAEKAARVAIAMLLDGAPFMFDDETLLGKNRDGSEWYIDHWSGVGMRKTAEVTEKTQ